MTLLVGGPCEQEKVDEAVAHGIAVTQLPDKRSDTLGYFEALSKALDEGQFDICHVHGNSGMVFPELVIAKCSRVVVVACHCHSTGCEHPVLHRVLRPFVPRLCDCMFACSDEAGKWLLEMRVFRHPNSFDLDKFRFDPQARLELRGAYGIDEDVYILGNVARLNPEKNHAFLIKVFEAFHAENPESILMIAGGGPRRKKDVGALVEGHRLPMIRLCCLAAKDPAKLYSAMDCFVFPSIHEGLGIVSWRHNSPAALNASYRPKPQDACVSDRFHAISAETAERWAGEIAAMTLLAT